MVDRSIRCCSLICDISDITVVVVSMVLDVLGATVREEDVVGSFNIPSSISNFTSIKVGARVIIMDSILILVGFGFFLVDGGVVRGRSVVRGRGMMRGSTMAT